jgi:hypothetical protein
LNGLYGGISQKTDPFRIIAHVFLLNAVAVLDIREPAISRSKTIGNCQMWTIFPPHITLYVFVIRCCLIRSIEYSTANIQGVKEVLEAVFSRRSDPKL